MKKRQATASAAGKRKGPDLSVAAKAAAARDKKSKSKPDAFDL